MNKYFDKSLFGERLFNLMEENNDTTYSLGEFLGLANSTISRYVTGEVSPKVPTVRAIAQKYNVNPLWLLGTEGADKFLGPVKKCKRIPIIGTIAAGQPILAQATYNECEYIPENENIDFALKVKGDSMSGARILDGDLVYVRKQSTVENGEIAVVVVNSDEEATLKRFYMLNGSVILKAENPNFPDITFNKKETRDIRIIGKAVFLKSVVR